MLVKKGDKIKLIKSMGFFEKVGKVCEVTDVTNDIITFSVGTYGVGCMSKDELEKYFVLVEEEKCVSDENIEFLLNRGKIIVNTVFDKCTIVAFQLTNGFVIVEHSACVDPKNYDEKYGVEECIRKIVDKVWELEGYALQKSLNENGDVSLSDDGEEFNFEEDTCDCCNNCDECNFDN